MDSNQLVYILLSVFGVRKVVLLQTKFKGTYFCCLRDPELQFLHIEEWGWWKNYIGLALEEGHTHVRNVILPFPKAAIQVFPVSWTPRDCDISPSLTNQPSFYWNNGPYEWCDDSKDGVQEKDDPSFVCRGRRRETAVAMDDHQCDPC